MKSIYFDNNATTFLDPVVAQRMHELNSEGIANPASQHRAGRKALHLLEEAKQNIIESVGASTSSMNAPQVILTSGGTEANNLALFGLYARRPGLVIVGGTDHPSVVEAGRHLSASTNQFRSLPVDENGICDLELLEGWLAESANSLEQRISLVSLMLGNNETGVLQDLKKVCELCRKYDVPVHSDIVQAVGKVPVDMVDIGLSAATLTAHKIHGPVGIGALILASDISIEPMIVGGGQQLGMRAGTEPTVPAVGLATSLAQINSALVRGEYQRVATMRNRFERELNDMADVVVVAEAVPRLPHTSNISFSGVDRQALHMALDLSGLACSTGSACSSGSGRPSGSLVAMNLPDETVQGSLRFSLSRFTTETDVDAAIDIVRENIHKCRMNV